MSPESEPEPELEPPSPPVPLSAWLSLPASPVESSEPDPWFPVATVVEVSAAVVEVASSAEGSASSPQVSST
ncbi:hypothetical protein ACE2AJ_14870 [Aquihabitans daechungensis]|uniref:hypothetical protein n=1 Tax=Aquihabitans daechungensis TaxID=1052257 RepID=UPI003BA09FBA